MCQFVLYRQDVYQVPVIPVGPDVAAGLNVHELGGNSYPGARALYASLDHIANAELLGDQPHIDRATAIGKAGVARDHQERAVARQPGDEIVSNAIREIFLLDVASQIGEG